MPRARLGRYSKGSRMGKPYARPSSYKSRQRGAGNLALAKVNRIIRTKEVKDHRNVVTGVSQLNAGAIFHVSDCPQGDAASSRDGNRIYGQTLDLRFQFAQNPNMISNGGAGHLFPPTFIRIIVFKSKANSVAVLSGGVTSYLNTTNPPLAGETNILAHKTNDNWLKNKTLWDRVYRLDATELAFSATGYGGMRTNNIIKLRCGGLLEYSGSTANANFGGIFVAILCSVDANNAGNAVNFTMSSMFRYVDV